MPTIQVYQLEKHFSHCTNVNVILFQFNRSLPKGLLTLEFDKKLDAPLEDLLDLICTSTQIILQVFFLWLEVQFQSQHLCIKSS